MGTSKQPCFADEGDVMVKNGGRWAAKAPDDVVNETNLVTGGTTGDLLQINTAGKLSPAAPDDVLNGTTLVSGASAAEVVGINGVGALMTAEAPDWMDKSALILGATPLDVLRVNALGHLETYDPVDMINEMTTFALFGEVPVAQQASPGLALSEALVDVDVDTAAEIAGVLNTISERINDLQALLVLFGFCA